MPKEIPTNLAISIFKGLGCNNGPSKSGHEKLSIGTRVAKLRIHNNDPTLSRKFVKSICRRLGLDFVRDFVPAYRDHFQKGESSSV